VSPRAERGGHLRDDDPMSDDRRSRDAVPEPSRGGPPVGLIAFAAMIVLTVLFILQNREFSQIDFLVVEVESRQWVIILVSIAIGVVLDRLFLRWWRRRRRKD
jgi:uncharacterized integral membrane protein